MQDYFNKFKKSRICWRTLQMNEAKRPVCNKGVNSADYHVSKLIPLTFSETRYCNTIDVYLNLYALEMTQL